MYKVLLVEDVIDSQMLVRESLSQKQAQIFAVQAVADALGMIADPNMVFDLIVMDPVLKDGSSFQLLERLSADKGHPDIPVVLLTDKSDLNLKLTAFELGAADFIHKSTDSLEIRARLEAQLRKSKHLERKGFLRKGPLTLEIPLMRAVLSTSSGAEPLALTTKEFKILCFLAQNEGQIFGRSELMSAIWGKTVHVLDRTVDSHICGLRKKLGPAGQFVECVPGKGYRFTSAPSVKTEILKSAYRTIA